MILALGGLVLLMLFVASAAQKYQAYQYEKEVALRRMLRGIQELEEYILHADGSGMPKAFVVMVHKEILARYVAIGHIHNKLENLSMLLSTAQHKLQTAEAVPDGRMVKPNDRVVLNRYVNGLTGLINFLNNEGHIAGMNEIERTRYVGELSTLRARIFSEYNVAEAKGLAEQGNWSDSAKYIRAIMGFIQNHAPVTEEATKLYQQANNYYKQIMIKQVPGSTVTPKSMQDQIDAAAEKFSENIAPGEANSTDAF